MTNGTAPGWMTRRRLLGAGALGVAAVGFYRKGAFDRLFGTPEFNFTELDDPAGFRVLESGPITTGGVPLFGLDQDKPQPLLDAERHIDRDLCDALFGGPGAAGPVPAAYFYDYQCPICKRLSPAIRAQPGLSLTWHDLAGLGPASEIAARASIAARAQGGFDAFHDRLMRARFQPTEGYIGSVAQSIGLDKNRLLADMNSPQVSQAMWLSRALAAKLGLVGTPGLVIGRTIVIGDINQADLSRLVALESNEGGFCT